MKFLEQFEDSAMKDFDFQGTIDLTKDFLSERMSNYWQNGKPSKNIPLAIEWMIVYFTSINGKATIMNPWFEAYIPMMIGVVGNSFTFVFNAWINNWWAEGNLILVADQVFATV